MVGRRSKILNIDMVNIFVGILITLFGIYDFHETIINQGERDFYTNSRNYGTSIFVLVLGIGMIFNIIEVF